MIVATEMQNINVNENKVPVQVTETILPPSLDDLDSVVIYKKETCCSLFTDSVYEVCPSKDAKPILLIEAPSCFASFFLCRDRIFDLYSMNGSEKTKIGHYQLPSCNVPRLKFPLDCYIGPEKVGGVYRGFTCCICGLPAFFANDSNGNTQYVIENNAPCTCCTDCKYCTCDNCCTCDGCKYCNCDHCYTCDNCCKCDNCFKGCCKETVVYPYKIHEKSINNPITGKYHVNYDKWGFLCCSIECHPYFDVKFSPGTTRELKFAMLGICLAF